MHTQNFFLMGIPAPSNELAFWLYSNAFAATAATIVSGALAERCRFQAYAVYTMCITGFIYPTANHWVNSDEGWLSRTNSNRVFPETNGLLDFASSGTVHLVGGMCALVGCVWLGPRKVRLTLAHRCWVGRGKTWSFGLTLAICPAGAL